MRYANCVPSLVPLAFLVELLGALSSNTRKLRPYHMLRLKSFLLGLLMPCQSMAALGRQDRGSAGVCHRTCV